MDPTTPSSKLIVAIFTNVIRVASPKLLEKAKARVREWQDPHSAAWTDVTQRRRRRLLFGLHSPPGFWMARGVNSWTKTDPIHLTPILDPETKKPILYEDQGAPAPPFDLRGYQRIVSLGEATDEWFNAAAGAQSLYENRLYLGGDFVNREQPRTLTIVERAHHCGLRPLRFRTHFATTPSKDHFVRVFTENGDRYEKKSAIDGHQFLVDRDEKIEAGPTFNGRSLTQDFLLLTILPTPERKGRIINVAARYGACERLHDILVLPEIVDEIWFDTSSTRQPGDADMRYPWLQALFSVDVDQSAPGETYQKPRLKHIHWMPQYGPIDEDRNDLKASF